MMLVCMRFKLLFMSFNQRVNFIKQLPVETRYQLRQGGIPYKWFSTGGFEGNIWSILDNIRYSLFSRHRLRKDWGELDFSMALWALPRLRILERSSGSPKELKDIIFAFEYNLLLSLRHTKFPSKEWMTRRTRGFKSFVEKYDLLWY
jgi:hypothetical protein